VPPYRSTSSIRRFLPSPFPDLVEVLPAEPLSVCMPKEKQALVNRNGKVGKDMDILVYQVDKFRIAFLLNVE